MHVFTCPGLPASWVNAWLAGIGATMLDRRIRLHWTAGDMPVAVLSSPEVDPVQALVESWPDEAFLRELPVADNWNGTGQLRRKVSVEQFVARVQAARGHPFAWALSSTMTDLSVDQNGEVAHAPFDPPAPKGITLHGRLLRIHELSESVCKDRLRDSLLGTAIRVKANGLGFDCTRLGSLADASDPHIDPVVELLAFFGLALCPVRGPGVDCRRDHRCDPGQRQRGWRRDPRSNEPQRFVWPAWQQPLDPAGVDALLDVWNPWRKRTWTPLGVHAAWRSVEYGARAKLDATRAIGSDML